ncbi:ParB/RepB/Spo0J family partition protein [Paraburkholderia sediminicola]|uniref:ParB/RepB/Spo0J family partition protein n=1 Tax=Paraburkholderia sediminicola TaxID=458836 RepID=UPI0038B99FA2
MNKLELNRDNSAAAVRIQYVAYARLQRSDLNVRRKAPTGLEAVAETILQKGILQNLVVHEVKGRSKQPKLGVCAGQRRLAALDLLFSQGRITKDYQVPVLIVSEGEAVAASLIENREREAMSIADESVAFRLLTEEGKSIAHVSALFKVSEMIVRRALKIANLSPTLLDLLRGDKMDYEQAKMLTLADDHATQERVWNDAHNAWQRRPSELRAAITQTEIDARDSALAKFVGLDAYEAAGGFVRRDLFSDGDNAGYIADADLLHRLATDRLIEISQAVATQGWSWIETRTRGDANELIRYGRVHSTTRKPTKNEKAELAALVAQRDAAHMELNAYYDEDGEEDEAQHDSLSAAVDVATHAVDQYAGRFEVFTPEDMQRAGAFVYLDDDGFVTIERGLIRPEERAAAHGDDALPVTATGRSSKPARVTPLHNEKLCRRLTAHRTAAIQTELARHPNVALAVLMSRMIPVVFEEHYERQYPEHVIEVDLRTSRGALVKHADDMADSVAWKEIEAERAKWIRMLPARADALLPWLLDQGSDIQSNLFAFCVAATVDGIDGSDRAHAVNSLADVLNVDLSYYWKPTRASYFDHVSKSRIADVLREHVSPQAAAEVQGMKKDAAAAAAEVRMAGSGWLPGVLANRAVPEFRSYAWEDDDADGEADDEARNAGDDPVDVTGETGDATGDDEGLAEAA